MRRSLMVMGMLSAAMLALTATLSYTEDLNVSLSQEAQLGTWTTAEFACGTENSDAGDGGLSRSAHAGRDTRNRAMVPRWNHGGRQFVPHHQDRDEAYWPPRGGLDGELYDRPDSKLGLAGLFSALETYVGIISVQLDAWRAYTSALIAFLEPPEPPWPPDSETPSAPPGPVDTAKPPQGAAPFFAERLADGAIARAEKAKTLKQAIDVLRPTLSAEQLARLAKAEPPLGPWHPLPGPTRQEDGSPLSSP